jgi:hypothetical protein
VKEPEAFWAGMRLLHEFKSIGREGLQAFMKEPEVFWAGVWLLSPPPRILRTAVICLWKNQGWVCHLSLFVIFG